MYGHNMPQAKVKISVTTTIPFSAVFSNPLS